jgi:hypothetical protein
MLPYARMTARGAREWLLVTLAAVFLTVVMTWPIAAGIGRYGRTNTSDGQWSIWVVSWVAHALATQPTQLYHANIFHPHPDTLAYSEPNIGAGILGLPAWLATRNPFATHNTAVLLGFVWAFVAAYALARYLTGSRVAAAYSAVAFTFCPFVFARSAHIQLLLTAGIPTALLAMHRMVDRPTPGRAAVLGLALVAQALCCGYYGLAAGLTVALGLVFFAGSRGTWRHGRYWLAVSVAAAVAVGLTLPFLLPTLRVDDAGTFRRTLEESARYSADWRSWLTSSAWAHRWMLPLLKTWTDVLFPGFLTVGLAAAAVWLVRPRRDTLAFYVVLALLGIWVSLGPSAGLYAWLFQTVPMFSLLRAPARLGILVTLALAVLAAFLVARLAADERRFRRALAAVLPLAAAFELATMPLKQPDNSAPPNGVYRLLASQPRGAVVELPFFWRSIDFHRHAYYMLNSTYHWQPLVNGYSDFLPQDFRDEVLTIASFPTRDSFPLLQKRGTRYAVFHLNFYNRVSRAELMTRLDEFKAHLRPLTRDGDAWLYEIVSFP